MMRQLNRNVFAGLCLLVLCCGPRALTQVKDVCLSSDRLDPFLPQSARFESAAAIGELTLVAWGTSIQADTGVQTAVVVQFVRSGIPVAQPRRIAGDSSRPAHVVSVTALSDRFVVGWTDEKPGSPGIYVAVVDTDARVGPIQLLQHGAALTTSGIVAAELGSVDRIFWSTVNRDSIFERELDSAGLLNGSSRAIAPGAPSRWIRLSGGRSLIERGDREPILIDADGSLESVDDSIASRFRATYWLDSTGRLVTVERDTVNVFAMALDAAPVRRVRVPDRTWEGSQIAMVDTNGALAVFSSEVGYSTGVDFSVQGYIQRRVETSHGVFGPPTTVGAQSHWQWGNTKYSRIGSRGGPALVRRTCSGSYRIDFDCMVTDYEPPGSTYPIGLTFFLDDAAGRVINADTACTSAWRLKPRRIDVPDSSVVDLPLASGSVWLASPLALRMTNVPEESPAIFRASDGAITVAWIARGERSAAILTRWNQAGAEPIAQRALSMRRGDLRAQGVEFFEAIHPCAGYAVLESRRKWNDTSTGAATRLRSRLDLAIADVDGWRDLPTSELQSDAKDVRLLATSRSLSTGTYVFATAAVDVVDRFERVSVSGVDSAANVLWRVPALRLGRQYSGFAINERSGGRLDVLLRDSLVTFVGDSIVRSVIWAKGNMSAYDHVFQPLHGDRVLYWDRTLFRDCVVIHLEDGRFERLIRNNGFFDWHGHYAARHPTTGLIADVESSRRGIQLTIFDSTGAVALERRSIGASPDSAFSPHCHIERDSVWIVWLDRRRGELDVYGTVVPLGGIARTEEPTERVQSFSLSFDRDANVLRVEGPPPLLDGPLHVEIVDALGRDVHRALLEQGRGVLELSELRSGIYVVSLRSGHWRSSRVLRIVR